MYKIIIKTTSFMYNFTQKEIENFGFKSSFLENNFLKVEIKNDIKLKEFIQNIFYYSRSIKQVFLEIDEFENIKNLNDNVKLDLNFIKKNLSFEVESHNKNWENEEKIIGKIILNSNKKLKVDLKNFDLSFKVFKINKRIYLVLDLIGFDLSKRNYKININSNSINSILSNYLFYLLELDKEKQISIIDPSCSLGDLIIEVSTFNPRIAFNIKKKNLIIFSKIFTNLDFPKEEIKNKNKYIGVVQNNKIFKQLKENISYSNSKIKTSQYEFNFLDIKFKKNEINFLICNLQPFKEIKEEIKYLKEFFYQAEFITKKKIGIITKKKFDEKILKKYKLFSKIKKEILIGEQKYFIYIILK